jgi:NTE family protein
MHALVLGGGGSRGAFSAGVAAALCERERFDLICGTSIGAINAALVAQGEADTLRQTWHEIAGLHLLRLEPALESWRVLFDDLRRLRMLRVPADLFRLRLPSTHLMGLMSWNPIKTLMESRKNYDGMESALIVSATNITHATSDAFYHFPGAPDVAAAFAAIEPNAHHLRPDIYVDSVCASAAIPGVFPPVMIDIGGPAPCAFADGMVANNTPIRQAIDAGATEVTIVFHQHTALRTRERTLHSLGELFLVAQDIADQHVLELDLKLARAINAAVMRGEAPDKRFVDLRVIGPTVPLRMPALAFEDAEILDRTFLIGYEEGKAAAEARAETWSPP